LDETTKGTFQFSSAKEAGLFHLPTKFKISSNLLVPNFVSICMFSLYLSILKLNSEFFSIFSLLTNKIVSEFSILISFQANKSFLYCNNISVAFGKSFLLLGFLCAHKSNPSF
jgi:hypothetical protein